MPGFRHCDISWYRACPRFLPYIDDGMGHVVDYCLSDFVNHYADGTTDRPFFCRGLNQRQIITVNEFITIGIAKNIGDVRTFAASDFGGII